MLHPFQHIVDLSEICRLEGIRYVIISPGSRNAPLIDAFYTRFGKNCYSIVDERSAAYFALGMARYSQETAVLISTSGTAVLNYSPAIAEAYYSQTPLLVLTADRPAEWIDQQDNQTIRQKEIYRNFIKRSYQLPEKIENQQQLIEVHHQVQEAIDSTLKMPKGPVHVNIPLLEPLYTELPEVSKGIVLSVLKQENSIATIPDELKLAWLNAVKILIVHGQDHPLSGVNNALIDISEIPGVLVIAENISNSNAESVISQADLIFSHGHTDSLDPPDLLLYSGGQVVSRRLKNYLRSLKCIPTWRIGIDAYPIDTFKHQNTILSLSAPQVYSQLAGVSGKNQTQSGFRTRWLEASARVNKFQVLIEEKLPFSDIRAMKIILNAIPGQSILEFGNSSVVRLFQYFDPPADTEIFSNRGVSGIDGSLSAASGTATVSNKLTVAIIGDLSFVYDSNALWNSRLSSNLRIIVLNNQGGGIFSLLEGPSTKTSYEEFFIAHHPVNLEKIAEAYNLDYFCVSNKENLISELTQFFQPADKAKVLEIKTERQNNVKAFRMMTGKDTSTENR